MQVTPINSKNRSLASAYPHSQVDTYKQTKKTFAHCFYDLYTCLLSIPVIALPIKIGKIIWHILVFIAALFAGKPLPKKQLATTALLPVTSTEEKAQLISSEIPEEQMKNHFLVMASHELKTPMTTILGQAQLMLRRLAKMPELSTDMLALRASLESINGQAHRLNGMVDDLLDLYNIRAGKISLRLTSCDLIAVCRDVITEQALLSGRTIELITPLESITFQADGDRLRQVMENLIDNALKYSSRETSVKVLIDQHRDIAILEVTDNGMGIPQDQQAHIFEPFYRSPDVQTTATSGMGLGLAICKDIVERHAGRIWCRSRVSKGSTFIVELPLKKRG